MKPCKEDFRTHLDALENELGRMRVLDITMITYRQLATDFQMLDIERALALDVFRYILDITVQ